MHRGCAGYGIYALAVVLTGVWAVPALAEVKLEGTLKATQACAAPSARTSGNNPGDLRLVPGHSYPVRARNKEGGDWLKLKVEGAVPAYRWVPETCGQVSLSTAGGQSASQRSDSGRPGVVGKPFFDSRDEGARDPAPPVPDLTPFDRGLLTLCGPWGSHPSADAFSTMLLTVYPEDVQVLRQALEYTVVTPGAEPALFVRELTDVWFREDGFVHVFCGEPAGKTLGGLHFQARYLQAQWAGWAARIDGAACASQAIVPPVYTVGVVYRRPGGGEGRACPKGYGYGESGRDLLLHATQAWKAARTWDTGKGTLACRQTLPEYTATVVLRNGGIRTFYPTATPNLNDPVCDRSAP